MGAKGSKQVYVDPVACDPLIPYCNVRPSLHESCCDNGPLQRLTMRQTWGYDPVNGAPDSWTMQSLWHDNRGTDGCDRPFRSINNVTEILRARKMNDLLADMKLHYSDPAGHNELVWRNEWNQHGTCVQTLQQYCYTAYETGLDVQNFFQTEMALFRSRPTYGILAAAEAIPQFHEKYKFSIIHKAVSDFHGADVTMHCDSKGHLYAIDYHYEQYGCFAFGSFVPKKFNGKWINHCPPEIVYYPKVAKKAAST